MRRNAGSRQSSTSSSLLLFSPAGLPGPANRVAARSRLWSPSLFSTGTSMDRLRIPSESRYAPLIGFSKAVRAGELIFLAGITAVDENGDVAGGDDAYLQTLACFAKIAQALGSCDAAVDDV